MQTTEKIRIEPQWNVNYLDVTTSTALLLIRIEPQWNVNSYISGE